MPHKVVSAIELHFTKSIADMEIVQRQEGTSRSINHRRGNLGTDTSSRRVEHSRSVFGHTLSRIPLHRLARICRALLDL
jgi:hypothetical protein